MQTRPSSARCHEVASQAHADNQVVAFLRECGLQKYAAKLMQNGFDEMETLYTIDDADSKDLGIPAIHAHRLRKSLRQHMQRERAALGEGGGAVTAFLKEHGLEQYAAALLNNGFDEMETLFDIEDLDLKALGLPRGHALKLKRHLREYQIDNRVEEHHIGVAVTAAPAALGQGRSLSKAASHRLEASETMKGAVERSWEACQQLGLEVVAEHVIGRFFHIVPEAMDNFPAHVRAKYKDWTVQENEEEVALTDSVALRKLFGKILDFVGCVVVGLKDSSKLVEPLTSLGGRHIAYGPGGVNEAFWPALGQAVIVTLSDLLGDGFTTEVENAWKVVFGFASSIMISAMRQALAASARAAWTQQVQEDPSKEAPRSRCSTGLPTDDDDETLCDARHLEDFADRGDSSL